MDKFYSMHQVFSYCMTITILFTAFYILFYALQIPNTLLLFEKFDEFIRRSKFGNFVSPLLINKRQAIQYIIPVGSINVDMESNVIQKYSGLIGVIERVSELVHFAAHKLTLLEVFLFALILSAINYFIYDKGDQSYFLPVPLMYVWHDCIRSVFKLHNLSKNEFWLILILSKMNFQTGCRLIWKHLLAFWSPYHLNLLQVTLELFSWVLFSLC